MPPPFPVFSAASLPIQVQLDVNGRRRKPALSEPDVEPSPSPPQSPSSTHPLHSQQKQQQQQQNNPRQTSSMTDFQNTTKKGLPPLIDLQRDCVLRRLTQYECEIENPRVRASPIVCYPLDRIFRE
jgi:hypothetical protein